LKDGPGSAEGQPQVGAGHNPGEPEGEKEASTEILVEKAQGVAYPRSGVATHRKDDNRREKPEAEKEKDAYSG